MFFYISIIISIAGLLFATYTDLKERIVPNKLNFGLALLGLILFGIQSIMQNSIHPIVFSIVGLSLGFLFGWILWKIGVFAGGDVKLFMALGALNPLTPALFKVFPFISSSIPLFPVSLFIYSLIGFLPYGLVLILYKLYKNKKARKIVFEDIKKKSIEGIHSAILIAELHLLISLFITNYFLEAGIVLALLILMNFISSKRKYIEIILGVAALLINYQLFITSLVSLLIIIVGVYGIVKLMMSTRIVLVQKVSISKIEEGMIPSKTLIWENKKVVEHKSISLKQIIKFAKLGKINDLFAPKKEIISSMKARGLIDEEIKELHKLAKKGLINKTILIKDSMPFVPTMLVGYILSLILGDAVIFLFMVI